MARRKGFSVTVPVDAEGTLVAECNDWCAVNCRGTWRRAYASMRKGRITVTWHFVNEVDAALFKLAWGGG